MVGPPASVWLNTCSNRYICDIDGFHASARLYTEVGTEEARNGYAWPYHATDDQIKTLPPTAISVNELCLLRDEGLHFAERLKALGVGGYSRVVKGTVHAAEISYPGELKEISAETLDDIASFAKAL